MRVTRTLHASVNVEGELARSVEFYQRHFHMPDEDRPHIPGIEGHWFATGNAQLHLVDAPAGPGPIRPAGPHVCFAVADLDEAVAELQQAGIPYVEGAQGDDRADLVHRPRWEHHRNPTGDGPGPVTRRHSYAVPLPARPPRQSSRGGSGWRKSRAALPAAIIRSSPSSRPPSVASITVWVSGQVESAWG